jgi:hypothetical protein
MRHLCREQRGTENEHHRGIDQPFRSADATKAGIVIFLSPASSFLADSMAEGMVN